MNDVCGRFLFAADMNGDYITTVTDVFLWIKKAFLLPSNLMAHGLIGEPRIEQFFEMDCGTGNGIVGGLLSFVAWMILLAMLIGVIDDFKRK